MLQAVIDAFGHFCLQAGPGVIRFEDGVPWNKSKFADMVLLDANPLDDIANTKKIVGVVVHGKVLFVKALEKMPAEVEADVGKR